MTGPKLTSPFRNTTQLRGQTIIPPSEVIDRLNACLGVGYWNYTVEAHRDPFDTDFLIAKGRLEISAGNKANLPPCVYEQFGGSEIGRFGKDHARAGQIIDLGDDYKGCASNAMKKCAQHIGVGLYLALKHEPLSSVLGEVDGGSAEPPTDGRGADKASGSTTSSAKEHDPGRPFE